MKRKLVALLPYIIILGLDFYLLPVCIGDTGSAMLIMLCVMPLAAFATAVAYGVRNGFSPLLSAAALLLFIPTVFIHYNSSAWVYAPLYGAIVLAGNGLGRAFYRKR